MNKKRPVNLDLGSMKFPPMAVTSILHRVSGVVLFILLPVMIFLLSQSLHSEEMFNQVKIKLSEPYYKLIVWVFSTALAFHILAGIRHMIMDIGFGEELHTGRRTSILVIVLTAVATIFLGMWIW